jgi:flagellar biosynthesis/type III secretory pathway protein FliH
MTEEQILELAKTCGFNSGNAGATYWECWERQLLKFALAIHENGYNKGYDEGYESAKVNTEMNTMGFDYV